MINWFTDPNGGNNEPVIRALNPAQRVGNTTRGSTPGLIDPAQGEAGGRIPRPDESDIEDDSEDGVDTRSSPSDDGSDDGDGPAQIVEKGVARTAEGTLVHPLTVRPPSAIMVVAG